MNNFFLLLFFISTIGLNAQSNCTPTELYSIKASSGMKMRSGPSPSQSVVVYLPTKTYLLVCKETSTPATFEGVAGHWRRVRYENNYGYMFDGFLQKAPSNLALNDSSWQTYISTSALSKPQPAIVKDSVIAQPKSKYEARLDSIINRADSLHKYKTDSVYQIQVNEKIKRDSAVAYFIKVRKDSTRMADSIAALPPPPKTKYQFATETYNYCGSIGDLDPSKRWYGVYYNNKSQDFRIRSIELQVVMSKYSLGKGVEFDIKAERGIPPHFMLGTNQRLDTSKVFSFSRDYFLTHPEQLYPGQKTDIYPYAEKASGYNFTLFATGNVTNVGICPEMTNYKLNLTGEMNDKLTVQNISDLLTEKGACGMPKIYWFGDLNSDNYPDFILASINKNTTSFTLFVSDTQDASKLVRKAATWSYSKCN